jgi:hypothetical protein
MTTKMATKEAVVSKTESLVLMKNMVSQTRTSNAWLTMSVTRLTPSAPQMRISISSICFVRDLFPRDCFKNKPYGNVDIHQLQGARKDDDGEIVVTHSDAFLLTQWLEQGVFHALEQEYLSSVTFAIYCKHPTTKDDLLLETYEFKTTYQAEGAAKVNDVALVSKESVKNQAAKFIRSLTEFSGTLDALPDMCWITLQLKVVYPAILSSEHSDRIPSANTTRRILVLRPHPLRLRTRVLPPFYGFSGRCC